MRYLLITLLMFTAPLSWGEEQHITTPFKCIVDYQGGVNHSDTGHSAHNYNVRGEEFRLVPRSHLMGKPWGENFLSGFPASIQSGGDGFVHEIDTYWIRDAANDPDDVYSWTGCSLRRMEKFNWEYAMQCGEDFSQRVFRLNLETMRFVHVYLGTWDVPQSNPDWDGNSSVFSYGTCNSYYD